jgi:hypothetical protein
MITMLSLKNTQIQPPTYLSGRSDSISNTKTINVIFKRISKRVFVSFNSIYTNNLNIQILTIHKVKAQKNKSDLSHFTYFENK